MKNTVDNLSKSKVILMCGPAGAGKSTLAKKFESTGMTILSYDEESFKRGLKEHPLPQEVLEDIKTYLDEKLISLIMQNIDIVLDYSFWSNLEELLLYSTMFNKYSVKSIVPLKNCRKLKRLFMLFNTEDKSFIPEEFDFLEEFQYQCDK